jgi:hypothetical protein
MKRIIERVESSSWFEIVDIEPEIRKSERGFVETYPTAFFASLKHYQLPLRWKQGFLVMRGKLFSAIYPNFSVDKRETISSYLYEFISSAKTEIEKKPDIEIWTPFLFSVGKEEALQPPSEHSHLKTMAEKEGFDVSRGNGRSNVGGGYIEFSYLHDYSEERRYLEVRVSGDSGEFGIEEDRDDTRKILESLFPEASISTELPGYARS